MSGFANKPVDPGVIARARRGDMQAHAEIFRIFSAPVFTLAARMTGSRALADDLLQDTFVEVIRSIHGFRQEATLATWIRRITVSKCLMHMRSAWHRRATLFRDLGEDSAPLPESVPQSAGLHRGLDLEKALARLPDVSRMVVLLHDVEGYTHQEIADLMGMSRSFSKSQLSRAHRRLQAMLGDAYEQDECRENAG